MHIKVGNKRGGQLEAEKILIAGQIIDLLGVGGIKIVKSICLYLAKVPIAKVGAVVVG